MISGPNRSDFAVPFAKVFSITTGEFQQLLLASSDLTPVWWWCGCAIPLLITKPYQQFATSCSWPLATQSGKITLIAHSEPGEPVVIIEKWQGTKTTIPWKREFHYTRRQTFKNILGISSLTWYVIERTCEMIYNLKGRQWDQPTWNAHQDQGIPSESWHRLLRTSMRYHTNK
jgi:hypothetical protein